MLDIYSRRIAVQQNGRWYWAHLTSGLVAVAHPNRPNQHHAICQTGRYGHIVPNPSRFLLIGPPLNDVELSQIGTIKFGFSETIDPSEDV